MAAWDFTMATHAPAAAAIGLSLPSPECRAGTSPPAYCEIQLSHVGHQESGRDVAVASHSSGVGGFSSFSACFALVHRGSLKIRTQVQTVFRSIRRRYFARDFTRDWLRQNAFWSSHDNEMRVITDLRKFLDTSVSSI